MKIADLDIGKEDKGSSAPKAPKERIPMIKEVFELVLGRDPSSRELSFYKYGVQEKEEIIEKLLNEKEHKERLEMAKRVPELESKVKQAEHRVVMLKQQIEDIQEETQHTRNLLDEKNKEIAILRREKQDPYNFTHSDALRYIKDLTENRRTEVNLQSDTSNTHFSSISSSEVLKKKSFLDKVYDLIKS